MLRPGLYRALPIVAAIVVVLGSNSSTGHAAVRASSTPSPTPSTTQPTSPSPSPAPDQTQPQVNQPGAGPTSPVNQPGSSSVTQPTQSSTTTTAAGPTREVFGFTYSNSLGDPNVGYPSWNFNLLSTVAFFSLHATYNGVLVGDSDFNVFSSSTFTNMVSVAHAHGVKVVVTISPLYGFSDRVDFCDTLYSAQTTASQLADQVVAKGIDGVNIDYEGQLAQCTNNDPTLDASDQTLMTNLAYDMRRALDAKSPGYYLSIDTYSGSALGNDGFFNIPNLNQYVDSFFVMAYDMDYSNSSSPPLNCSSYCLNPVSPMTSYFWNDTNSMSQYSGVVGAGKVILGQPYYGRVACVSYPYAHAYPTGQVIAASYLGAVSVASSPDVAPGTYSTGRDGTDSGGLDAWTTWYDNASHCWKEMYWDDTTSLAAKYNLVNRDHLRGVGIWTLNYGGAAPELWDTLAAYFQTWSAGYDMGQAPTQWVANQPQTFPITVTNSGTYTWPSGGLNPVELSLHFTSQPNGASSTWLTDQIYRLPNDVAPGASVTFNVTATAPANVGGFYLEAQVFKYQQFAFGQRQQVQTYIAPDTWIAHYDTSQVPTAWQSGQTRTFPITVTNSGNVPWPSTGTYEVDLDLHFATSAGGAAKSANWVTSQAFSLPGDVAPGASTTVSVTVTAPSRSGQLVLEAEMIKEHQFWFQQWQPVNVNLVPAGWAAGYDMSHAPASWIAGQAQTFPVTVTNTGTQPWPATGYTEVDLDLHFATSAGGVTNSKSWLTSQTFALPSNVAPGASATLNVTVTPGATGGSLVLEAEMIKEHQFWFNESQPANVTVAPQTWSATYDMSQAPTTWVAGQSQTFPVTVTNTGNVTWPATGYTEVDLDLHFATSAGGSSNSANWLTNAAFALPAGVAPSASATVNVTVTAPSQTGSLVLEAELIKEHQFWFQQWQPVTVTNAAAVWSASYDLSHAPTTWTAGHSQTFQVTVTNTGNVAWPATGYTEVDLDLHFTTVTGGSAQSSHWLTSQTFSLGANLAPNASVTLTVTVTAPTTKGSMSLEAEVIKEHQFWFTQASAVTVTVA